MYSSGLPCVNGVDKMRTNRRLAMMIKHRYARGPEPRADEEVRLMESYRNAIIKMLDTITDVKLMKMIYEIVHAVMTNR